MLGTFPYYSDGVAGEKYGTGNYKATNGRLYKVSTSGTGTPLAWYPAPGYRVSNSGAPVIVGNSGHSWSSAVSSTNGLYLGFLVAGLGPSDANSRALGLQLRCLSNPQGVLLAASALIGSLYPIRRLG
ncbi:hypothetical protein [uncultured Rikenella sp.]|uniref:hypothetical protein n=1 Tax=uncultured Rikenella sp. TaxID=368003 RepID=UPI0026002005|nr:hypothetical protein [uncultured Rikenella sp.]